MTHLHLHIIIIITITIKIQDAFQFPSTAFKTRLDDECGSCTFWIV